MADKTKAEVAANVLDMLHGLAEDAADEGKHDVVLDIFRVVQAKPGVRTSEFVFAVVAFIIGFAFQFWPGHESVGGVLLTAATVAYPLSRGMVKSAQAKQPAAAPTPPAAAPTPESPAAK